ncbi:hypothetical protein LAZ67_18002121 [Cordylochernes scorpioides]|uniref:Mos1 transposase HTH domain-containing protein n=1 Tax=Cordylochernes scorpioides TaxID=51811 RepID=A0ABY6LJ44_9ARAC|nr:hypothetical protein LAZ67_18002121 [Cordylochernes scorpioides]
MEVPLKDCTTLEQRAVIRFLNAEGIQTSQICQRMKNIYGESCLSQKYIYKWVNEFKNGRITCSSGLNVRPPCIRNKRRGKLSKGVLFLHDNARPHTSCKTVSTIIKLGFEVLEHPAYSPDLAPSDYSLFGLLKKELKGKRFDSDEDVQKVVQEYFPTLPKSAYKEVIYKLQERWRRCIESQGVLDRLRFLPIKKIDQSTCIKFCVKNEIKCANAFRMLTEAYGEATLDRSNIYRWYKMFSEGREDVNDEERAGRPSTSTTDEKINEVEKMILASRRITVREVAEDLNISIGLCHSNFINDLGMRRVTAKFVPKLLNCDQKQHRMNIANEMLDSVRDDPNLLQRVITGDEAWVYGYDVETKAQSSQWNLPHEPRPKKARQVRSNVKVLLTVFFDCRGVVHHEFLPQGILPASYAHFARSNPPETPGFVEEQNWLLHHDNAPAHTSLLVRDFLAKINTLMIPQLPYSPDLAPCDLFLFPKLKRPMKGRRYATLDEIKTASKEELKKIF